MRTNAVTVVVFAAAMAAAASSSLAAASAFRESQLELVDQPLAAFRALAEAVTLEQLNLQRLKCDAGFEIGVDRAGVGGIGASYSGLYFGLIGTHHRDCKLLPERDNIGRR